MTELTIAAAMATVANRLVAGLIAPLFDRYKIDCFFLMYASWIIGALLVFTTGVNVFAAVIPSTLVGQLLTALVCGGGANLIHDVIDAFQQPTA